jgi:hypothetical protein
VKTGVQAVLKAMKILDSGFHRKKDQAGFFHTFGGKGGEKGIILDYKKIERIQLLVGESGETED